VIAGLVAVLAPEVHAFGICAHVDIVISLGLSHNHIQISMLDRVPAPAGKMAIQAAGGSAWTSDLLRDLEQVNLGSGNPAPAGDFL